MWFSQVHLASGQLLRVNTDRKQAYVNTFLEWTSFPLTSTSNHPVERCVPSDVYKFINIYHKIFADHKWHCIYNW